MLLPLTANAQLGPLISPANTGRQQYPHELSETCSLTDRVFRDNSGVRNQPFNDFQHANPLSVQQLPTHAALVDDYASMIEEHVERRILFFFQQAISCYRSGLHFEAKGAMHQAKSATKITIKRGATTAEKITRQAAHSSTLPCLVAYSKQAWDAHIATPTQPKPPGYIYLKNTDYYRINNATMNMPRWINDADREIDEKRSTSLLRDKALVIINSTSLGLQTPDGAVTLFMRDAIFEVDAAKQRLVLSNQQPEVVRVLDYYARYFRHFQTEIRGSFCFLGRNLDICFDPAMVQANQKRLVLKLRYGAIRKIQVQQSKLIQKIAGVRKNILTLLNRNRKPAYFEPAFRTKIIASANGDKNKQRIQKLFNFSSHNFEHKINQKAQGQQTRFNNTKALLNNLPIHTEINNLTVVLVREMGQMRQASVAQRATTTFQFRTINQWTQKELGQKWMSAYPHAKATSQSTVSRIERGTRIISDAESLQISTLFKVDQTLFMPQAFFA